jgi:hypothetical protein
MSDTKTLYERLGGYDAITAVGANEQRDVVAFVQSLKKDIVE